MPDWAFHMVLLPSMASKALLAWCTEFWNSAEIDQGDKRLKRLAFSSCTALSLRGHVSPRLGGKLNCRSSRDWDGTSVTQSIR